MRRFVSFAAFLFAFALHVDARAQPAAGQPADVPPPPPGPPPPSRPPAAVATDPVAPAAVPPGPCPPCPSCDPTDDDPWNDGKGARLAGGVAFTEGLDYGVYGRLEFETFATRPHHEGLIGGVLLGAEGWGSLQGGGGGLPFSWYGGFRGKQSVFATLGFGWDWVIYDKVEGDGGFGIFAPMANAHFGLDFEAVRILAEGRVQYRWQWGADDRYQVHAGLALSFTDDH